MNMVNRHPRCASMLAVSILGVLAAMPVASRAQAAPAPRDGAEEQPPPAAPPAVKPEAAAEPAQDDATSAPSPAAAQTAGSEPKQLDAVVVTGLRSSIQSAQAIKRDSEQIVDSIVAEDIGKLPDITASASLARITGVQVTRASGEAADVQVRGLPNIETTYNGRELFTAENRNVALQDFPAGGVAGLDVYKSSTADLIEGGIAGLINVRSRRPFDFEGRELSGSFNGVYTDQADRHDLNGNFLASNRWQTGLGDMGFLINAAWNRLHFLDSTREESLVMGVAQPGQTDQPGFRFPDALGVFFGQGERTRPSVNAAFQWRPNERWEINADALFQGFRAKDSDHYLFVPLFAADTRFSNVVLAPGAQGDQAQRLTATGGLRPEGFQSSVDASTDTYQVGLGAVYRNEGLRWSTDVAYTDSTFKLKAANIDYAYASTPVRDVDFNLGGDGGSTFHFRDFDPQAPSNYLFRGLFDRNYEAKGDDLQARTDLEFTPESGWIAGLQGGLRFNDRSAERRNGERYSFQEPLGIPLTDLPLDFHNSEPGFDGAQNAPLRGWFTPTRDSIRRNVDQLRALVGFSAGDPDLGIPIFSASEKAYTAYGQLKYQFDAGVPIDGAIGLRAVKTETEVSGLSRDNSMNDDNTTPVSRSSRYTDYLPNASMRLRLSDEFQIRLAATKTRTRPNFDQLNPATTLDQLSGPCIEDPQGQNCVRTGSSGNPDLTPLESKNYDVSFEYYFAPAGSATLAVFRRDVSGFISNFSVDQPDPVYNIVRINRPENGGDGKLQGVEAAFTSFLDVDAAPDWARAFGLQANYTYIDNGAELGPTLAASLPGKPRIPGVSKNAYNVVLLYEKPVFSARLAYNWRSKYVAEYAQIFDPALGAAGPTLPLVQDDRGVLDFSLNVTPVPALTFAFDVSNILGDPITNSRQYNAQGDVYPRQVKYLERVWSLGVRFRF